MNKALFVAAALSFAATVAHAQTEAAPPTPPQPPAATPPPSPGPEAMRGPDGMRGQGRHGPGAWRGHHGMPSKAAHFRIRAGDVSIDVKCAEDDTTAACGQTVMQIIDKLQAGDADSGDSQQDGGDTMNE